MPRNRRPRKRFMPKHAHADASLCTLRRAADRQAHAAATRSDLPLQVAAARDLAIGYHSALDALRTGQATEDHVTTLSVACNVALLLCESGLGADWMDKVRESQDALVTLQARRNRIGRYVTSGLELQRLVALLDLHDAQLDSPDCTEGLVARALVEIQRRVTAGNVVRLAA